MDRAQILDDLKEWLKQMIEYGETNFLPIEVLDKIDELEEEYE